MDIKLLKTAIKQNNIPKFLIFNVEEPALSRQYIDSISNTVNKYHKYYDSAKDALYDIHNNMKDDFLYVILNDTDVLQSPDFFEDMIKSERNIIVYFTELDTKLKTLQPYKDYIVNFKKLTKYTIVSYLMKQLDNHKITVSQEKIEDLVDYCNCSLGCCMNELDKIITLNPASSNAVFDYMMENGFSDYRQTNLFSFIHKVLNREACIFDEAQRLDESFIGLIFNLYKQAKLKVTSAASSATAVPYIQLMQLCSTLDSGIKDGTISETYALDYLLIKAVAKCQ